MKHREARSGKFFREKGKEFREALILRKSDQNKIEFVATPGHLESFRDRQGSIPCLARVRGALPQSRGSLGQRGHRFLTT